MTTDEALQAIRDAVNRAKGIGSGVVLIEVIERILKEVPNDQA